MTENETPTEEDLPDLPPSTYQWERPDPLLQQQVSVAVGGEDGSSGLSITVLTRSGPVSGTIISYEEWAQFQIEQFFNSTRPNDEPDSDEDRKKLRETLEQFYQLPVSAKAHDQMRREPRHVHLKDPTFFIGSTKVGMGENHVMRLRLAEVVGWMLGTLALGT
jgi:hypothetical protein